MHHSLWLTKVNWDLRVNAVKGVRAARKALGDELGGSLARSLEVVRAVYDEGKPVLIGRHPDIGVIRAAGVEAESSGGCTVAVDLTPEEVFASTPDNPASGAGDEWAEPPADPDKQPDETREPLSSAAYETAMVLLCITDGNPVMAMITAGSLKRSTQDADLYEEVQAAILRVFPPAPTNVEVAAVPDA